MTRSTTTVPTFPRDVSADRRPSRCCTATCSRPFPTCKGWRSRPPGVAPSTPRPGSVLRGNGRTGADCCDQAEADVEAVCEEQRRARLEVGRDRLRIYRALD